MGLKQDYNDTIEAWHQSIRYSKNLGRIVKAQDKKIAELCQELGRDHKKIILPIEPEETPPEKIDIETESDPHQLGADAGGCKSCGQLLYIEGGYAGSGLCGPCCTGDADTGSQAGETW
jgi:hypothetical protein